jgi:hypothetical protein
MHEHHGKETHQGTKTEHPNIIQFQQKESTAHEYEHGHCHGCRAAPLHERWHNSLCNTNLPMHTRKKATIPDFASARSSKSKGTHKIHPILVNITVALNGISIELQPRHAWEAKARCLRLRAVAAAAPGVSAEPFARDVALQGCVTTVSTAVDPGPGLMMT